MRLPNNTDLLNMMKHFSDTLWEYDITDNRVFVYYDAMTPELENRRHDFDQLAQFYKDTFLHELDLSTWERYMSPEKFREFFLSEETSRHFTIRFSRELAPFSWHDVFMEKLDGSRILLSSRNIHDDIRNRAIGKAVETEFDYVAYIDIKTRSYILYHSSADSGTPVPPLFYADYHEILHDYNSKYVPEDQRSSLTKAMEIETVVKELENKSEYILFATHWDEQKQLNHTKLRFCYLNEEKEVLLLSRTNINDITREHTLRREAERKQLEYQKQLVHYLDHMPIAYCTIKIILDGETPVDFMFTYSNYAHARLENTEYGELIGKSFYRFFENADPMWLRYYHDTAYNGVPHTLDRYSPEVDKHLLIYTFQPEYGFCGCILLDVTEQKLLAREVNRNRLQIQSLLKAAADFVFQYNPDEKRLRPLKEDPLHQEMGIPVEEILEKEFLPEFETAISDLQNNKTEVSFQARAHVSPTAANRWYEVFLFDFHDYLSGKNLFLGYMKDITSMIAQQELLQKEATLDPLTGILNAKAGRQKIEKLLREAEEDSKQLLFIMDIDNFKSINDTKGHLAGDEALIRFAWLLSTTFRKNDVCYRLGGDEFVAFVGGIKNHGPVISNIMKRFFDSLSQIQVEGLPLGSSVGIFVGTKNHSFDDFYKNADKALYETKCRGKNGYTVSVDGE